MTQGRRGFVDIELMIVVCVVFVGMALLFPPVMKLAGNQPLSGWNWTALVAGGVLTLGGAGRIVMGYVPYLIRTKQDP